MKKYRKTISVSISKQDVYKNKKRKMIEIYS